MAMNKWLGIGRLTADPELRQTQTGTNVVTFKIAVNRAYRKGQERQADFFTVIAWRSSGEFVSKFFRKGDPIQVEGRLETRNYTDSKGVQRYVTEIIADKLDFVEGAAARQETQTLATVQTYDDSFMDIEAEEDDLPF